MKALTQAIPNSRALGPIASNYGSDPDSEDSDRRAFHDYVDKLAQICDSRQGGECVTAFTVLEWHDEILYVCGSNSRSAKKLEEMKAFMTDIIQMLKGSKGSKAPSRELSKAVLKKILKFNKQRLEHYLKSLECKLGAYLEYTARKASFKTPDSAGSEDDGLTSGSAGLINHLALNRKGNLYGWGTNINTATYSPFIASYQIRGNQKSLFFQG